MSVEVGSSGGTHTHAYTHTYTHTHTHTHTYTHTHTHTHTHTYTHAHAHTHTQHAYKQTYAKDKSLAQCIQRGIPCIQTEPLFRMQYKRSMVNTFLPFTVNVNLTVTHHLALVCTVLR